MSPLVKAGPRLLVYKGRALHNALRAERVAEAEVLAAIRQQAQAAIKELTAVVLETDGRFTVIPNTINHNPRRSGTWPPRNGATRNHPRTDHRLRARPKLDPAIFGRRAFLPQMRVLQTRPRVE